MGCGCNKNKTNSVTGKTFAVIVPGEDEVKTNTEIEARALVRRAKREGKEASWEPRTA